MCGIAGWVAPAASAPDERALQPMFEALAHRGPDGAGSASFSAGCGAYRVVLGHRRLAIIDPNGSRQPMRDDAAGLALTFNGEIYNFRELRAELEGYGHGFERDSDTEVLLRAYQEWGTQCVRRLRGQENMIEVQRILKAFVDAQWLAQFDERLAAYRAQIRGGADEE